MSAAKIYNLILMFLPESVGESSKTFNFEQQILLS